MIPPAAWLAELGMKAEDQQALLDLIREIQYDARISALEDIEQYVKKQQLKKE